MYEKQSKKLLILNILDILRKYTDADHRLSQKEIQEILETEYSMTAERKSIRRNLMDLIDFGYAVEYSESVRMVPNPRTGQLEESCILSDFYLERDFTDSELRLLIDSSFPPMCRTHNAKSLWKSWRGCPISIFVPVCGILPECRRTERAISKYF